ncbi:MAG: universal stress protein [Mycobacteriaceae bacterium]
MSESRVVVVGVDGSAESHAAVRHALRNAVLRGDEVRAIVAVPPPDVGVYDMMPPPALGERLAAARVAAHAVVTEAVAHAVEELGAEVEQVPVRCEVVLGTPAEALLEAAKDAIELVVGHRGRGAFRSALLGSVGLSCVLHAACPVTVVRPAPVA